MKKIVITVAILSATPAVADDKREAGKVVLYTGVGVLAVATVFAGVLGWGFSNACGKKFDDGCSGFMGAGAAGMIINGPMALSLLLAGGQLYYEGAATPAKTASLITVHF